MTIQSLKFHPMKRRCGAPAAAAAAARDHMYLPQVLVGQLLRRYQRQFAPRMTRTPTGAVRRAVRGHSAPEMKFTIQRYDSVPTGPAQADSISDRLSSGKHSPDDNDTVQSLDDVSRECESPVSDKRDYLSPSPTLNHQYSLNSDYGHDQLDIAQIGDSMGRRGRIYAKRQTRRLVFKDGSCNIHLGNVKQKRRRYLGDMFTTLLDMQWRYVLLMFLANLVGSWLIFAFVWWVICVANNDHINYTDPNWEFCVSNVYDFATALLFSIETQHTIGYGSRAMESKCPEAIITLMLQSCIGVFIMSFLTGTIFAKMSRPKRRGNTLMFCRNAVICQRDGKYVLLFRVADMRKSFIVDANIRATLVQNRITKEGEVIPLAQVPLPVEAENAVDNYIFLLWPTCVSHEIDDESPLYHMSAESLLSEHFEIIVYLEGTVESTGMTTQVRTSYLPSEIHWGHKLAPLVTYQKDGDGDYKVDYTQFHTTIPLESMPECSAEAFAENEESNRGRRTTAANGMSHHMSFVNRLPGVPSPRTSDLHKRLSSLHSYTVGANLNSGLPPPNRRRTIRNGEGLSRRRSVKQRVISKINGLVRSNSLDAFSRQNRRRPVDILGTAEPPVINEPVDVDA